MAVDFGDAIGTARVKWRGFALRHLHDFAEHLAGAGLIKADFGIDDADRIEYAGDAQTGHVAGENRLIPRCLHKRLRRQVIDFIGFVFF